MLVGLTGYLQQSMMARKQTAPVTGQAAQMQTIMKIMPVFFALISFNIQAAVVLYWIAGNIWTIGQQAALSRFFPATPAVIEVSAKDVTASEVSIVDSPKTRTKAAGQRPPGGSGTPASTKPLAGSVVTKGTAKATNVATKKQPTAPSTRGNAANTRKKK